MQAIYSRILTVISVLFLALLLTGCFEVDRSIITAEVASPLPGGLGQFLTVDRESGEKKTLEILQEPSGANSYTVTGKDKRGDFEAVVHLLHVDGKNYVLQIYAPEDGSYMIFAAQIDADTIRLAELDTDDFKIILQSADITTIIKPAFGKNAEKNAMINKLKVAQETYAVAMFGFTLYGDENRILEAAKEMVRMATFDADSAMIALKRVK